MKQLIYTLAITLFLALLTGCEGSSTPPQEGAIAAIPSPGNPDEGDTPDIKDEETMPENEESIPTMKLSADPASNKIFLRWTAVNDVTDYALEWSEKSDTLENSITLKTAQTQFLHQDLEPETIYYYRIKVKNRGAKPSKTVAVKTGRSAQIMQSDVGY